MGKTLVAGVHVGSKYLGASPEKQQWTQPRSELMGKAGLVPGLPKHTGYLGKQHTVDTQKERTTRPWHVCVWRAQWVEVSLGRGSVGSWSSKADLRAENEPAPGGEKLKDLRKQ